MREPSKPSDDLETVSKVVLDDSQRILLVKFGRDVVDPDLRRELLGLRKEGRR